MKEAKFNINIEHVDVELLHVTLRVECYARTLCGATKCPERRESGALLFYEQWVSI